MGEQRMYYGRRIQTRGLICEECGRMYVGIRGAADTRANYCGGACRQKAYRRRNRVKALATAPAPPAPPPPAGRTPALDAAAALARQNDAYDAWLLELCRRHFRRNPSTAVHHGQCPLAGRSPN